MWTATEHLPLLILQVVISSSFESSVGLAACAQLAAALPAATLAHGLGTLDWFEQDIMFMRPAFDIQPAAEMSVQETSQLLSHAAHGMHLNPEIVLACWTPQRLASSSAEVHLGHSRYSFQLLSSFRLDRCSQASSRSSSSLSSHEEACHNSELLETNSARFVSGSQDDVSSSSSSSSSRNANPGPMNEAHITSQARPCSSICSSSKGEHANDSTAIIMNELYLGRTLSSSSGSRNGSMGIKKRMPASASSGEESSLGQASPLAEHASSHSRTSSTGFSERASYEQATEEDIGSSSGPHTQVSPSNRVARAGQDVSGGATQQEAVEKPLMLFLHGFLGTGEDWAPLMTALSLHYRCVAVDLPGHGRTHVAGSQHLDSAVDAGTCCIPSHPSPLLVT